MHYKVILHYCYTSQKVDLWAVRTEMVDESGKVMAQIKFACVIYKLETVFPNPFYNL